MIKHAMLSMAHNQFEILEKLMQQLDHGRNDLYIHIDRKDHQKRLVMVNPFSVKKIKELDDNSPKKTDSKDPKTIAKLVVDGRYSIPYVPECIFRKNCASVPEERSAIPLQTEQSSAG